MMKRESKEIRRQEVLKGLGATAALVPLSSLLWQGGVQAAQQLPNIDPSKIGLVAKLVDRVIRDPEFRKTLKARPVETLREAGLVVPPDLGKIITALKDNPEKLRKTLLGESLFFEGPIIEPDPMPIAIYIVITITFTDPGIEP